MIGATSLSERGARAWKAHIALALVLILGATGVGAVAAEAADGRADVRVMVRNLYLGADLVPLILAPTQQQFRQTATQVWRQVKRTDFPARSRLIAREIEEKAPDLIGLQEVSRWRRSDPGQSDGDATPATNDRFNFLRLLQQALRARGERYRVAVVQQEADLEGPTSKNFDVRLTMRDVILERRGTDLNLQRRRGLNFRQNLVVPTAFGPVESTRGWTAVDVRLDGTPFRFVNTHLEAFEAGTRAAQAQELTERRAALDTNMPTILVGDLNSDPNGPPTEAAAYEVLRQDGLHDAWIKTQGDRPGLTCCFNAEVKGSPADFTSRIDDILFRNGVRALGTRRVGIDPENRTASGLWPSDHAGLVANFRLGDRR
jgi:endonuclease/exonuclease/phosphatase family metal-dependent hydrolase